MFFKRFISHFQRLKGFKFASYVLTNGVFKLDSKSFKKIQSFNLFSNYPVFTLCKNSSLVTNGNYHIGMYKTTVIGTDYTYYCYRKKKRYLETKGIIERFASKIPYNLCDVFYSDKNKMMYSPTVKGEQFFDRDHYEKMTNYLLESYKKLIITNRDIKINNDVIHVPYCIQHGDCHLGNIFWTNDEPLFIDLDDMGNYPLFYDFFYFLIRYHKNDLTNVFLLESLKKRINNALHDCGLESINNPVDYFLSLFILHWANNVDKRMSKHDASFLFGWINNIDLKLFPASLDVVRILNSKLSKFNLGTVKYDV